jgi:hypothetical protein
MLILIARLDFVIVEDLHAIALSLPPVVQLATVVTEDMEVQE